MGRIEFEPFGERLAQADDLSPRRRGSAWLLSAGSALFWLVVVAVVAARAVWFEPDYFAAFARVVSAVQAIF